ncbi:MAG: hypothetical protein K2Z81_13020, partial [Cyanobacteria bacterium]|nr:hypothetical protein [Cyanobacteriota bacterium]
DEIRDTWYTKKVRQHRLFDSSKFQKSRVVLVDGDEWFKLKETFDIDGFVESRNRAIMSREGLLDCRVEDPFTESTKGTPIRCADEFASPTELEGTHIPLEWEVGTRDGSTVNNWNKQFENVETYWYPVKPASNKVTKVTLVPLPGCQPQQELPQSDLLVARARELERQLPSDPWDWQMKREIARTMERESARRATGRLPMPVALPSRPVLSGDRSMFYKELPREYIRELTGISKLYERAGRLSQSSLQRILCRAKAALYRQDWKNAWSNFELAYPQIKQKELVVKEIAQDYHEARRDVEARIWLSRHMEVASSWNSFADSSKLRDELANHHERFTRLRQQKLIGQWQKGEHPLLVAFPTPNQMSIAPDYKEQIEKAMFFWLNATEGKLQVKETTDKSNADIVFGIEYREKEGETYSHAMSMPESEPLSNSPVTLNVCFRKDKHGRATIKQVHVDFVFTRNTQLSDERKATICLHMTGHALGILNNNEDSHNCCQFGHDSDLDHSTLQDISLARRVYESYPVLPKAYQEYVVGLKADCKSLNLNRPKIIATTSGSNYKN